MGVQTVTPEPIEPVFRTDLPVRSCGARMIR
jgi:hypothetical protein